ncbi:PspC domain-containing protein [Qipengyuania sp. 1NDH17]|uniref:PspC domain-containing protein n=1 Tax=Qipengyuania polymorpha TaxID=2867234 RepID=A0ABS7IZH5_9SPHN|nr:PspC domain-containing protein [Qipengyuania polymorpha]MBX7457872.1 PspC domain-containing protein [Qipengyuania polymorpha]
MSQLKFRENDHAVKPAKGFRLDHSRGKLMGVCSGISRYTGIDSTWVRLGFVVGAFLSFGTAALIYLAIGLIAD